MTKEYLSALSLPPDMSKVLSRITRRGGLVVVSMSTVPVCGRSASKQRVPPMR